MKRLTTGVAAALLALVVTGCGESGGGDAVAWADGVCTGMKEHVTALTTQPEIDQSDPASVKEGLITYLNTVSDSLDGMASVVEEAGVPSVEGGDEAVEGLVTGMTTAKESLRGVQAEVEAAPVDDPAALQAAASGVVEALSSVADPMASLEQNKELKAAYDEAPACKELGGA